MKFNKSNVIPKPLLIGVASSVFGVLIIRFIDYLTGSNIFNSVWAFIKSISISIIGFFNQSYQWKLYSLILLFLSGLFVCVLSLLVFIKIQDLKGELTPEWRKYLKDEFDGIIYRWEYLKTFTGDYEISLIEAYCPKCECKLISENCPNCKSSYFRKTMSQTSLNALILHRIEQIKKET